MKQPVKVYIASSFLNKAAVRRLTKYLTSKGVLVLSTWTKHRPTKDRNVLMLEAIEDLTELQASDILVVIWPGRFGTNAEIGGALMDDKPVIMYGDVPLQDSVYFNHPLVYVVDTYDKVLWYLKRFAEGFYPDFEPVRVKVK